MNGEQTPVIQNISSYIGKLFRDNFGKGPESVFVSVGLTYMTVHLRNLLTPAERVLMDQDQTDIIVQMRDTLIQRLYPELKGYIQLTTGVQVQEMYYDWNLHNRSGMITFIGEEPFPYAESVNDAYPGKPIIDQEIINISQQAQKIPEELYSFELNSRTILIVRNGILVRIEKELIRLGHSALLKRVKRNLEKSYLHNNGHFEAALNRKVIDVFCDWDFERDRSIMLLVTGR